MQSCEEGAVCAISAAGPDSVVASIDAFLDNRALTQEQVRDVYNRWSGTYESDLARVPLGYNNPRQLTDLFVGLAAATADRQRLLVLDVACGTGLVGERLRELGFRRVDGVDGSAGMLEVARGKGAYRHLFLELVGDRPLKCAQPRAYDALLTTGSFCPNHLAPSCLRHLGALVKPGGLVGIGIRKEFLTTDPVLRNMEPELLKLQSEGLWEVIHWEEQKCYYGEQPGMFYILKVT